MYSATVIYLGNRIISGALDYTKVITNRPDLRNQLDSYLVEQGKGELIVYENH